VAARGVERQRLVGVGLKAVGHRARVDVEDAHRGALPVVGGDGDPAIGAESDDIGVTNARGAPHLGRLTGADVPAIERPVADQHRALAGGVEGAAQDRARHHRRRSGGHHGGVESPHSIAAGDQCHAPVIADRDDLDRAGQERLVGWRRPQRRRLETAEPVSQRDRRGHRRWIIGAARDALRRLAIGHGEF